MGEVGLDDGKVGLGAMRTPSAVVRNATAVPCPSPSTSKLSSWVRMAYNDGRNRRPCGQCRFNGNAEGASDGQREAAGLCRGLSGCTPFDVCRMVVEEQGAVIYLATDCGIVKFETEES